MHEKSELLQSMIKSRNPRIKGPPTSFNTRGATSAFNDVWQEWERTGVNKNLDEYQRQLGEYQRQLGEYQRQAVARFNKDRQTEDFLPDAAALLRRESGEHMPPESEPVPEPGIIPNNEGLW